MFLRCASAALAAMCLVAAAGCEFARGEASTPLFSQSEAATAFDQVLTALPQRIDGIDKAVANHGEQIAGLQDRTTAVEADVATLRNRLQEIAEAPAPIPTPDPPAPKATPFDEIVNGEPLEPSWVAAVYSVRVTGVSTDPQNRGQTVISSGGAVAVRPNMLHSCRHLYDRISGYRTEVQVDGQWIPATVRFVGKKDLVTLAVNASLNPVPVRVPVYGEPVTVYGLTTKSFAQGRFIGDLNKDVGNGLAPLEPGAEVSDGDSGGGVFGDDGALLGTLSGFPTDSRSVVSFVPIVAEATAVQAPKSVANPPPQQGRWVTQQVCNGRGRCTYQQVWVSQ